MRLLLLIMTEVFNFRKNCDYSLRSSFDRENSNMSSVHFENESTRYLRAKIWKLFPST